MSLKLIDPQKGTILEEVDSTNNWLKDPEKEVGSWVRSRYQYNGRGRKGKVWIALGDEKIIFSCKLRFGLTTIPLPLLSLMSGASLLKAIFSLFPEKESEISLKWPNDIYRGSKKIAGFLIEGEVQDDLFEVIIGFGLNIYGQEIPSELIQIADFLFDEDPIEGTSERIILKFIEFLNESIISLMDPSRILKELQWLERNSLLLHKIIETNLENKMIRGRVLGYDENGFLLVLDQNGFKHSLMDTGSHFEIIGEINE
ncbi:MAG: biotin--[acetyl-CoA-carboxylase] ligase [Leptospira sp.]|jgi:BirA family transcriptional regulator, biotin operon repressor / biotin---[acetyl-CoA-carboxylase] ligase|nr:biotin--[acetyl-CoA-carboxylase] ligase [Leptospira sp.]